MDIIAKLKEKSVKEVIWAMLSRGVAFLLFTAINIMLARELGVEQYGTWSFFYSLLLIIFIFSFFGVNGSTRRFVAKYNKTDRLKSVIYTSVRIRLAVSLLSALILLLCYKPLAHILGKPFLEPLLLWSAPLVVLHGLVEYLKSTFSALHRLKYEFILNAIEYGAKFTLVLCTLMFTTELLSVLFSYILASILTTLIGSILLYTLFYRKLKGAIHKTHTKDILSYSVPLAFIGVSYLVTTQVDVLMIGLLRGEYDVGIYSVAKDIITKLPRITTAIAFGTLPVFAKINATNKAALRAQFAQLLKFNGILFFVLLVGISLLAPFFVPLFYGEQYVAAVIPLQILSIYVMAAATSVLVSGALDYMGRAKERAVNLTIALVVNIILNFLLIPPYGVIGAAIATVISFVPSLYLNWREVQRALH